MLFGIFFVVANNETSAMDKTVKQLLDQMKAKKFRKEEEEITVQFFSDGLIIKLFRVLICLAVGVEVIDKLSMNWIRQ